MNLASELTAIRILGISDLGH